MSVVTLGCRLNLAESEAIAGFTAGDDALVVVNSCAVTAEAVRETRKAIRRAHRERPGARILVTGCAAETERASLAAMPEVAGVVANAAKLDPAAYGLAAAPLAVTAFGKHARAFVPVQNGCDHACTFCIIPAGRGPNRSVPAGAVIERIAALVDAGHREVVLTGVDVTSYGADLPGAPTLGSLVERILRRVPALPRLRLSSLDPAAIDPRLFDLIAGEPRVMPHLHLSLQAGDDLILKRMRRRHSRAEAVALVQRVKARRDVAVGADLIAGFPTEGEAAAANSLALIDDCDIVFGHIFPYSPRTGTPAARMPQVFPGVVRARAAALRAASERRRAAWLPSLVGTTQQVLLEGHGRAGHAESFVPVALSDSDPLASPHTCPSPEEERFKKGDVITLRITAAEPERLIGTPA